jgi:hypothetical protein
LTALPTIPDAPPPDRYDSSGFYINTPDLNKTTTPLAPVPDRGPLLQATIRRAGLLGGRSPRPPSQEVKPYQFIHSRDDTTPTFHDTARRDQDDDLTARLAQFDARNAELQDEQSYASPYGLPGDEYELSEPIVSAPIVTQGEFSRRRKGIKEV